MPTRESYWFPAKRHGWGWGPPVVWQGWLVLALFAVLIAAGAVLLLPRQAPGVFVGYCLLLCLVLVAVCWVKGEPPDGRARDK